MLYDRLFSEEYSNFRNDIIEFSKDVVSETNGYFGEWTPTISGSATKGSGTYTGASTAGYYFRQGILVDLWFLVTWTAHTGAGNMMLDIPFTVSLTSQDFFTNAIEISGINLSANYTYAMVRPESNSLQAAIIEVGDDVAPQNITMDATAALRGHVRYVGKDNV